MGVQAVYLVLVPPGRAAAGAQLGGMGWVAVRYRRLVAISSGGKQVLAFGTIHHRTWTETGVGEMHQAETRIEAGQ